MRKLSKYVGGLVLAALLLWLILRSTEPQAVWQQLQEVSIPVLLIGAAVTFGQNIFRVWRWRDLLAPVKQDIPFGSMFVAVVLGYAVSFTVPGRLGELIRPALLSGREDIAFGPTLGSVLADRLMDVLAILCLFTLGTLLTPLEGEAAQHAALIRASSLTLTGVIAVPFFLLLGLSNARTAVEGWLRNRRGPLAWVVRSILALARGTEALLQPRLLARISFHSFMAWLMVALGTWIGLAACGVHISYASMLVIMPLLVLGIALPTPGGTGGYHTAMTLGLSQLFGVDYQLAVAASILLHLAGVVPAILVSGFILLLDRDLFQDLRHAARQVKDLGSGDPGSGTETADTGGK